MTDTTKDPVSAVSESAAEAPKLARILFGLCEGGGPGEDIDIYADEFQAGDGDVYVHRAGELLTTLAAENKMLGELIRLLESQMKGPAAIQHSEQRETVPAGEISAYWIRRVKVWMRDDSSGDKYGEWTLLPKQWAEDEKWNMENGKGYLPGELEFRPLFEAAPPVAAPVPEAIQPDGYIAVTAIQGELTSVAFKDVETARDMADGDITPFWIAPAVKHEASELPPLPPKVAIGWKGGSMSELAEGHTDGGMSRYGQLCYQLGIRDAARQPAPPIAVQGSIGDDAEFQALLKNFYSTAYSFAGSTPHPDALAKVIAYIDSRSPVAAASFPERDELKPAEQQGMYRKFEVRRVDGSDQPGGKHHGCRYFVLDLKHDAHAPAAMRAYAVASRATHPQLAAEIEAEFGPSGPYKTIAYHGEFLDLLNAYASTIHRGDSLAQMDDAREKVIICIERYFAIDSRSPVAAAPEDVRKAALEEAACLCEKFDIPLYVDLYREGAADCTGAIRALSAAAPSADAKAKP